VPGAAGGSGRVYEDDGETFGFQTGESMLTELVYTADAETGWVVRISAGNGTFGGAPATRENRVWLRGVTTLGQVGAISCDGVAVKATSVGAAPGYWMDGAKGGLVVACDPTAEVGSAHTILVAPSAVRGAE
jgi:hypothetical protein